jgi:hypothetical protein
LLATRNGIQTVRIQKKKCVFVNGESIKQGESHYLTMLPQHNTNVNYSEKWLQNYTIIKPLALILHIVSKGKELWESQGFFYDPKSACHKAQKSHAKFRIWIYRSKRHPSRICCSALMVGVYHVPQHEREDPRFLFIWIKDQIKWCFLVSYI